MFLVIDCGNTNTVFGIFNYKKLNLIHVDSWRIETAENRTEDSYFVWLDQILKISNLNLKKITGVAIASVVPEVLLHIKKMIVKYLDVPYIVVGDSNVNLSIKINIDNPNEAGSDRLVNACAVKYFNYDPAIVIDFGTATTFDVIGENGSYEGGIIAPGVNLSLHSLYQSASNLPKINVRKLDNHIYSVIGKNTISAMESGIYWGYVSMVEGLINKIKKGNDDYKVIATGGLSQIFKKDLKSVDIIDKNLTLKGLASIYLCHFKKIS